MRLNPTHGDINIGDDHDPVADAGQRLQSAIQHANSVLSMYANQRLYRERTPRPAEGAGADGERQAEDSAGRAEDAANGAKERRRPHVEAGQSEAAEADAAPERWRPAAGRDGADDKQRQLDAAEVDREPRPARHLQPVPDMEAEQQQERDADAADAADAAALQAQNDDDPRTVVHLHGTNPRAKGPRSRDAAGDASEHLADEAADPLALVGDPLSEGTGDPLAEGAPSDDPGLAPIVPLRP